MSSKQQGTLPARGDSSGFADTEDTSASLDVVRSPGEIHDAQSPNTRESPSVTTKHLCVVAPPPVRELLASNQIEPPNDSNNAAGAASPYQTPFYLPPLPRTTYTSDNYRHFDDELTFEEFLGESEAHADAPYSVPLDSPEDGFLNGREFVLRDASSPSSQPTPEPSLGPNGSTHFPSSSANTLRIGDLSQHDAEVRVTPQGPSRSIDNCGLPEPSGMGFLSALCCFRPQNRASQYHVADDRTLSPRDGSQSQAQYSWDLRKNQASDYIFSEHSNEVLIKKSGEISGQQFVIDNCKDCIVILLDHSGSITVDDSDECLFVFGPCSGSVFLRNCNKCFVYCVTRQFRVRDSTLYAHLFCGSQPIIEDSRVDFFPLLLNYDNIKEHMVAANLSPFYNCWSDVYDYTPGKQAMPKHFNINASSPETEVASKLEVIASAYQLSFNKANSFFIIPEFTKASRSDQEVAFVIHKKEVNEQTVADFFSLTRLFIFSMLVDTNISLLNMVDFEAKKGDMQTTSLGKKGLKLFGHLVVMEFAGPGCQRTANTTIEHYNLNHGNSPFELLPSDSRTSIYRFAKLKHGV